MRSRALVALIAAGIALCVAVIARVPSLVVWDEAALLGGGAPKPSLAGGIVPQGAAWLLAGLVGRETTSLDFALRAVAAVFYLTAFAGLAARQLRGPVSVALAFTLVLASGFPLLWLASETLAGGWLFLCLLAFDRGQPRLFGLGVAGLSLTKPDLPWTGLLLLLWAVRSWDRAKARRALIHALVAGALAIAAAAAVGDGLGSLPRQLGELRARGFHSLVQHYAAVIAPYLPSPHPDPWQDWHWFAQAYLPGVDGLGSFVVEHPRQYLNFVALSLAEGAWRVGRHLGALVACTALCLGARRSGLPVSSMDRLFAFTLLGLLPALLVSFVHVRYLARYQPLAVLFCVSSVGLLGRGEVRLRLAALAAAALLAIGAAQSLGGVVPAARAARGAAPFFFLD